MSREGRYKSAGRRENNTSLTSEKICVLSPCYIYIHEIMLQRLQNFFYFFSFLLLCSLHGRVYTFHIMHRQFSIILHCIYVKDHTIKQ